MLIDTKHCRDNVYSYWQLLVYVLIGYRLNLFCIDVVKTLLDLSPVHMYDVKYSVRMEEFWSILHFMPSTVVIIQRLT